MQEIIVGGVAYEVCAERFEALRATDAIVFEDGDWVVNHDRSNFTLAEVLMFLDLNGDVLGEIG